MNQTNNQKKSLIFSNKHPRSMYLLALTTSAQRFLFWGVANLLILFLIQQFDYSTLQASRLFALYTAMAFLFPILGGYIADKWNYKAPILLAILLSVTGSLMLSSLSHTLLIPGLFLLALGAGLSKPSTYSLLGSFYVKDRQMMREGGFSIFYAMANIGSFLALILLGYLQTISWRSVFLVNAVIGLAALIPFYATLKTLPLRPLLARHFPSKQESLAHASIKRHELERLVVILVLIGVSIIFWAAYNQAGSSLTLFANDYTDRQVGTFTIPAPWFTSAQAFFVTLFAFPLAALYLFLKRIKSSASPPMKTALSLFFIGLCFLVMERAALVISDPHTPVASPRYLIFAYALLALAELFLTPIGLSLVTNLSPHRYRGLLTGFWFTCIGIGCFIGGYISGLIPTIGWLNFFDIFVFASFIPAFILVLFSRKLDGMRHVNML